MCLTSYITNGGILVSHLEAAYVMWFCILEDGLHNESFGSEVNAKDFH